MLFQKKIRKYSKQKVFKFVKSIHIIYNVTHSLLSFRLMCPFVLVFRSDFYLLAVHCSSGMYGKMYTKFFRNFTIGINLLEPSGYFTYHHV
jgi:hypothetical protein